MAKAAQKSGKSGGPAFPWRAPAAIFLWTVVVQGIVLWRSALAATPVSPFFFGDSLIFLEEGRRLAEGLAPLPPGLPYHPPLLSWLAAALWVVFGTWPKVSVAAKLAMIVASGATWALTYRLLLAWTAPDGGEQRGGKGGLRPVTVGGIGIRPLAFGACLAAPLYFGELVLTSAVSTEVVYRLLLVVILLAGWRRPLAVGALHGVAALTRAEHLPLALGAGVLLLAAASPPGRRLLGRLRGPGEVAAGWWLPPSGSLRSAGRYVGLAAAGLALVVVPYAAWAGSELAAYNRENADRLPEPLPVVVPISFYGPLNFALAHGEEEIFFSRRTLPPPPGGGMAALDPTFPPHNEVIVHGYRIGLAEIAERPGRFLARTGERWLHSVRALVMGWTWRDLPRATGEGVGGPRWIRQPVDIAYAPVSGPLGWVYGALMIILTAAGAAALWRRGGRAFVLAGAALLLARLAVNTAFFPYLRSIMVAAPFYLPLVGIGLAALLGRAAGGRGPRLRRQLLAALLGVIAAYHLLTALGEPTYRLDGERAPDGSIIDDRRVEIRLVE